MRELRVVRPAAGEVIGDAPERRVEVLAEHDALHATWVRMGPHREGADLHVHRRHTDLFYVLDGELTVRLGPEGDGVAARAGTLVRVPPLVVHGYRNASDADATFLNCHAPGQGFAEYLRALRDARAHTFDQEAPPPDGGRPPEEASVGGDGVVVDRPGVRVALLADGEAIGAAEIAIAAGVPTPPAHRHRRHAESVYVLAGNLEVTAGDRALTLGTGTWLTVPADVPHAFAASGSEGVRFLTLHAPCRGFGGFVRALRGTGEDVDLDVATQRAGFDRERA